MSVNNKIQKTKKPRIHKTTKNKNIDNSKLHIDSASSKFYKECATMLTNILANRSSIRTEVYKNKRPQRYYAILTQIFKNITNYRSILTRQKLKLKNEATSLIYVHEIINGNLCINNEISNKIKLLAKEYEFKDSSRVTYVRVNTLFINKKLNDEKEPNTCDFTQKEMHRNKKISDFDKSDLITQNKEGKYESRQKDTINTCKNEQKNKKCEINTNENIFNDVSKEKENGNTNNSTTYANLENFTTEIEGENTIIPYVYKITKSYKFDDLNCFINGLLVVQNISSCLPAFILNPLENQIVIDACSAPGNKTTHLCAIMNNTGQIFAYEKDEKRFNTLNGTIKKYGCTNTKTWNQDFLETDTDQHVDCILVDPSCSGSGVHDSYEKNDDRINKLSQFQKKILCHALRYKNVSKVVYSTCSIHREENEDVVAYCLERNTDFKIEYIDIKNLLGNDKNHINIDMHEKSDLLDFNAKYEHKKQPDLVLELQHNNETTSDINRDEENVIEKENKYKVYDFENKILRIEKNEDENIQGFFVALFMRK